MDVKIKRIGNGKLPTYETEGSAGADCYARIDEKIYLWGGQRITIPLGFAVEIPEGYEMQIRGRSGLARKNGIDCFQGTIDSDYRGEVSAILINTSDAMLQINPGDRIAQAVIAPVIKARWNEVEELSETKRGEGGFGSTGVSEIKVAYPHKVEKFYEPFQKIEEVREFIGKTVWMNDKEFGEIEGQIVNAFYKNNVLAITFRDKNENEFTEYAVSAFQKATIDGHRFGKEMELD